MARQFVIVALIFFAIVAMASAAAPATESTKKSDATPTASPSGAATTAPVGGPESAIGTAAITAPAPAPSGASTLEITTIVGVVATTIAASFF